MPHEFARKDRVAELLRRELGNLIARELNDPRLANITVNAVSLSPKLSHAKVYVSSFETERMPDALKALRHATGFLRHELSQRLDLRAIPELKFVYDDTEARAAHLDELIEQAREEDKQHPGYESDGEP